MTRVISHFSIIKQHFIIPAEDVHNQLTNLNTNKSESADEIHPIILANLIYHLATPLEKVFYDSLSTDRLAVE